MSIVEVNVYNNTNLLNDFYEHFISPSFSTKKETNRKSFYQVTTIYLAKFNAL